MIGNNTLELNQETINKAIEYWLNETQLKNRVIVRHVTESTTMADTYFVEIEPSKDMPNILHEGSEK